MRLSMMIYSLDSSVLEILDWCVPWASKFRLTFVMQCSVAKKSVRVIFASLFQSSLLCVFWKGKFPPVPLSSTRRLLNQIQQDHCRIPLPNTYEVPFALFLWLEICLGCIWNSVYLNNLSFELKQYFPAYYITRVNTVVWCPNSSCSLVTGLIQFSYWLMFECFGSVHL